MAASPTNMPISTPEAVARRTKKRQQKEPQQAAESDRRNGQSCFKHGSPLERAEHDEQDSPSQCHPPGKTQESFGVAPSQMIGAPRNCRKSTTLDAARELSEPLALDMATAKMAAMTIPRTPEGIAVTMKSGKTQS